MPAARTTATTGAVLINHGATVIGVWMAGTTTAGSLTLRDTGSTGAVVLQLDTPTAHAGHMVEVGALYFGTLVHVATAGLTGGTVFYL